MIFVSTWAAAIFTLVNIAFFLHLVRLWSEESHERQKALRHAQELREQLSRMHRKEK